MARVTLADAEAWAQPWAGDGSGYGLGDGSGYGLGDGSGDGAGYGAGDGSGYGSGDGSGCGLGDGSGNGSGHGSGAGAGYGLGDGSGNGSGHGSGAGAGYGSRDGSGDGSGYGYGAEDGAIASFDGHPVVNIDGIDTVVRSIRGDVLRGWALHRDLTKAPCFVVRENGVFAHGSRLADARMGLEDKLLAAGGFQERAERFRAAFDVTGSLTGHELSEWHALLTGSCKMGREQFICDRGIDLNRSYTPQGFADLVMGAYGWDAIEEALGDLIEGAHDDNH